ncbi:FAD-dependent oxidoreductase [Chloroflexota bacterium]
MGTQGKFSKLFEQGQIGTLKLKNRIVMASMGNRLIEPDGRLSPRGIDYYVARAKGGTGLIITTGARTGLIEQIPGTPFVQNLLINSKIYGVRLNELAEAVHDYGARVAVQVMPGWGRNASADILRKGWAVSPSPLPGFADPSVATRALTTEEVERLVGAFGFMAEVIRNAGIDAIEINAHSGYLCDEFMTSLWNKRTDKYGGDLDGRLTFIREIITAIKKGAGSGFPVIVKYGLTHFIEGGRTIEEGLEIARKLEAAGVDALDIDAGCYEAIYWHVPPTTQPPGCMVHLAEKVKKTVKIPVIAVGKLHYPELAERVLQEKKADFIAMGRGLLADPEWANKVKEGRLEDICPCIGDNEGCRRRIHESKSISCTVNPACGMEREFTITPAEKKKNVLVVGGGPGGMAAARVATLRGHRVTLLEKGSALGGSLIPASAPDTKQDYKALVSYLATQIQKLGVELKLATEATPELIIKLKPEVVFVAAGGTEIVPDIPGSRRDNVVGVVDVLMGKSKVGERVVVIGGGITGCEVSLHLAKQGKKVIIVEMLDAVAGDMYFVNRTHLLKLLADNNVEILTKTRVLKITGEGVSVTDGGNRQRSLEADTVVLAVGLKPNNTLLTALSDQIPEVYAVGDSVEPRKVYNAIMEGFRIARLV